MVSEVERQAIIDEADLRLLPVFYWVLGALDGFFSLYGLMYVGYGVFMIVLPSTVGASKSPSPDVFFALMGWFMIAMGAGFIVLFGTAAVLKIMNGFWISGRRRRTASLVVTGLTCISFPFGTIVGVFTYLAMLRPSIKAMYDRQAQADSALATPAPAMGHEEQTEAAATEQALPAGGAPQ